MPPTDNFSWMGLIVENWWEKLGGCLERGCVES